MKVLGRHLLIECYGCSTEVLSSVGLVEEAMVCAANESKAQIVDVVFHRFEPHGVSGVVVIRESHFAIHTWPEYKFASLDIYICGNIDPWVATRCVIKKLDAKHFTPLDMRRGILVNEA